MIVLGLAVQTKIFIETLDSICKCDVVCYADNTEGLLGGMIIEAVIRSLLFDNDSDMDRISSELDSPKPTSKDPLKTAIPIVSTTMLAMGLIKIVKNRSKKNRSEQLRKNVSDLRGGFLHDHEKMYEQVNASYDEEDEFYMKLIHSKLFQAIKNEIFRRETSRNLLKKLRSSQSFKRFMKKTRLRKLTHKGNKAIERVIFQIIGDQKKAALDCVNPDSKMHLVVHKALIEKIRIALNHNFTDQNILPISPALFYAIIKSEGSYLSIIRDITKRNLFDNSVFLLEILINTVAKNFIGAKPKSLAILSFSLLFGITIIVLKTLSRKQLIQLRIILLVLFTIRFANIETCEHLFRELEPKSFVTVVDGGKYKTVTKYELPRGINEWEK